MVRCKSWTLLFSCWVVSNSFVTLWTVAHQAHLSMRLPRQEYWSGLPCPPPGDLPNPGISRQILYHSVIWEAQAGQKENFICNLTYNYNCLKTSHRFVLISFSHIHLGPMAQRVKNPLAVQELQETRVWSLGQEDPLEEKMATHSSILSWRIPWTEKPGGLQSMGSQRVDTTEQPSIDMLLPQLLSPSH